MLLLGLAISRSLILCTLIRGGSLCEPSFATMRDERTLDYSYNGKSIEVVLLLL